uniref:Uncharacterized protein n=1 Tax=Vespula pensylvanica TaxID=30213 RepID=A0A834K4P4_VESPE|nr:hypothetical protein H0235_015809 [Vespula pensylvanica]
MELDLRIEMWNVGFEVPRKSNAKYYLLSHNELVEEEKEEEDDEEEEEDEDEKEKEKENEEYEEEEEEEEPYKRSLKLTIGRSYGTYGVLAGCNNKWFSGR